MARAGDADPGSLKEEKKSCVCPSGQRISDLGMGRLFPDLRLPYACPTLRASVKQGFIEAQGSSDD